jgi:hypothetical protein
MIAEALQDTESQLIIEMADDTERAKTRVVCHELVMDVCSGLEDFHVYMAIRRCATDALMESVYDRG